jgi:hypothetical protein
MSSPSLYPGRRRRGRRALFSLTRSIIGLEYRGFEAAITPRGERKGLAHAVIRSAVIGIIVIIVSHYLSRLQLI